MAQKLSRREKYQALRDQIELESMETRVTEQPVKLSRVQNNLSHATRATYPHEDIVATKNTSTSQVMDELLGEVKQYNIDNGNRYTDDTQINILKQLDTAPVQQPRNQHLMPMEEEEELGSTMEMPRNFGMDLDGIATFMPNQKLTRINPVNTPIQPEIYNDYLKNEPEGAQEVSFEEYFKEDSERIVLGSGDIGENKLADTDHLDIFEPGKYDDEFDITEEEQEEQTVEKKPRKPLFSKKKKKMKKAEVAPDFEEEEEVEEIPSAKIRMTSSDADEYNESGNKAGMVLNIILALLVIALFASIAFTVYFLYNMGI